MPGSCYDLPVALLVFLDIDGCLRRNSAPLYQLEPHLVENLERFVAELEKDGSQVEVVISSSWKDAFTLDEIRGHFPASLRPKIVGAIPTLTTVAAFPRYREIRAYLKANGLTGSEWLAVDDDPLGFPPNLKNLILVDPEEGFQPARNYARLSPR